MTVTPAALSHAELADAFRAQARGCALTGSPIYSALLDRAADDVARGGLFADLVSTYRGVPMLDALPLRVLGAVHALVLGGRAPGLAAFYPSTGGHFEAEGAFRALCEVCDAHRDELRDAAATLRVQTNEVQRSAVLVPGFLRVAARTGLPLRIREIGSSAGLNLFFDRHRYEWGPHRFGDAAAPLVLAARWNGGDAFRSAFFNALSMSFPVGEQYFIDSVRNGLKMLPEAARARFADEVQGFVGQEATHRRIHALFNAHLARTGAPNDIEQRALRRLAANAHRDPRVHVAATAATEHFTAVFANWLMRHPEALEGAEPRLRTLWMWHAAAESEHRSTAFDVYQAISGDHAWRIRLYRYITVTFLGDVMRQTILNLRHDGSLFKWSTWRSGWRLTSS